jgi:alkylation response protein AidB-like acyl-CoA dehydrogenase
MSATSIGLSIDSLAAEWVDQRADRFQRRHLERSDFDALAATGFTRLIVPVEFGGEWVSLAESGPAVVDAVSRLAVGDQSVALVAAMHHAVMIYWSAAPQAPVPWTEAWAAQRAEVFRTAVEGHFWGTITSEPDSGGDIMKTAATATPVGDRPGRYCLTGAKHFGSGSEIVSYMITTSRVEGVDVPLGFFLDLRTQPWDGTAGATITRRWDGVGMKATQSHAVFLDGAEATALAWPGAIGFSSQAAGTLGLSMFCGVIKSVVDAAILEADRRLSSKTLRAYEDVEWTHAQIEHWMLTQAYDGLLRAVSSDPPSAAVVAAMKAKMGMATLAESILGRVSRAVGGSAFSASSPFSTWNEDVRALGFLRPPWALAFDQLSAARKMP